MKIKVLCKIICTHGVYGTTGQIIEVPDAIGAALCKGGKKAKAETAPTGSKAINEVKE